MYFYDSVFEVTNVIFLFISSPMKVISLVEQYAIKLDGKEFITLNNIFFIN